MLSTGRTLRVKPSTVKMRDALVSPVRMAGAVGAVSALRASRFQSARVHLENDEIANEVAPLRCRHATDQRTHDAPPFLCPVQDTQPEMDSHPHGGVRSWHFSAVPAAPTNVRFQG